DGAGCASRRRTADRAAGARPAWRRRDSGWGTRRPARARRTAPWRRPGLVPSAIRPPPEPGSQQALLLLLLARDAVLRPGHRLRALVAHLVFAQDAEAVGAAADALQGLVHELEHVALVVRQAEQELLGVGVRRLVGDVLRPLLVGLLAVSLVLVIVLQD